MNFLIPFVKILAKKRIPKMNPINPPASTAIIVSIIIKPSIIGIDFILTNKYSLQFLLYIVFV